MTSPNNSQDQPVYWCNACSVNQVEEQGKVCDVCRLKGELVKDQQPIPTPRCDQRKFWALPDGNLYQKIECVFATDYADLERELIAKQQAAETMFKGAADLAVTMNKLESDNKSLQSERDRWKQDAEDNAKDLCQIQDWLQAGGDIIQSSSQVAEKVKNRIRDLIATEGEWGDLKSERDKLRKALTHYANREMWRKEVIDSYSGEL